MRRIAAVAVTRVRYLIADPSAIQGTALQVGSASGDPTAHCFQREVAMGSKRRLLDIAIVLAMLLSGPIAHAGQIRFTFGLTRSIDACEDAGDRIRYRSNGKWYESPRADVQEITELTCTPQRLWEPERWDRTTLLAKQERERGDRVAAERLCVEALQYVDASAIRGLQGYAALLKSLNREGAQAAQARADKFREAKTQPRSGSVYLGFIPSGELRAYAALLREGGRSAEAEVLGALANAYDRAQQANYIRAQEQARGAGGDPLGIC